MEDMNLLKRLKDAGRNIDSGGTVSGREKDCRPQIMSCHFLECNKMKHRTKNRRGLKTSTPPIKSSVSNAVDAPMPFYGHNSKGFSNGKKGTVAAVR